MEKNTIWKFFVHPRAVGSWQYVCGALNLYDSFQEMVLKMLVNVLTLNQIVVPLISVTFGHGSMQQASPKGDGDITSNTITTSSQCTPFLKMQSRLTMDKDFLSYPLSVRSTSPLTCALDFV